MLIFAPLLALLYMASRPISVSSYTSPPTERYVPHPEVLHPIVTRADLEKLAAGESVIREGHPITLARTLLDQIRPSQTDFGDAHYQVALSPARRGSISQELRLGWPFPWLSFERYRYYGDIANQRRPLVLARRPPTPYSERDFDWMYLNLDTHEFVHPESMDLDLHGFHWHWGSERSRWVQTRFHVSFQVLLAMTTLVLVPFAILFRASRTWRRRDSCRVLLPVICAISLLPLFVPTMRNATSASSPLRSHLNQPTVTTSIRQGFALASLSRNSLREIIDTPTADTLIAASILAAAPEITNPSPDDILFAAASADIWNVGGQTTSYLWHSWISMGWTDGRYQHCPHFGPPTVARVPRGIRATIDDYGEIRLTVSSGDLQKRPMLVDADMLGIIGAPTLILAPGLIPFLLHRRFTRRRAAKRERKNLCPSCGYPLPSLRTP